MDVGTHTQTSDFQINESYQALTRKQISADSDDALRDAIQNQIPSSDRHQLLLRAKAIANVKGKKSSSSQTLERSFWREIETQIFLPVDAHVNTLRHASSNTRTGMQHSRLVLLGGTGNAN